MTDDVPTPVRVVFRRWRDGGGVIALFPELPADTHGIYCDSYMHVGQHGGADYHAVVRQTDPATPEESAAMAEEPQEAPEPETAPEPATLDEPAPVAEEQPSR